MSRLKSWESPRRQGRNDKGKGGSARKRQLKKRLQMLRNQLKSKGEGKVISSFFCFQRNFILRLSCRRHIANGGNFPLVILTSNNKCTP